MMQGETREMMLETHDDPPAQAPGAQGSSILGMLPLFLFIGVFFYFFIFRPQQKKEKEQNAFLAGLQKDDMVLTTSGIYGKIASVKDDTIQLEIAKDVRILVSRRAIRQRVSSETTEATGSEKAPDKSDKQGKKGN